MRGVALAFLSAALALPLSAQAPPLPPWVQPLTWSAGRAIGLWWTREHDPNVSTTEVYHAVWQREAAAPDSAVFDWLPYLTPPREADGIALAYDEGLGGRMWSGVRGRGLVRTGLQA